MALKLRQLANAELTTGFVTLYTTPALTNCRVLETAICNTSGATRTVTMCFVEVGDTATDAAGANDVNAVTKDFDLPAGMPIALTWNTFLNAGDFIAAKASGDGVTFIASGIEEDPAS